MKHRSRTYPSSPSSRRTTRLFAVVTILATLAALAPASSAQEAGGLRGDVPSGQALRDQIAELRQQQASVEAGLEQAEADLAAALAQRDQLGEDRVGLAADIEELRKSARRLALSSFVNGGRHTNMRVLLDADGPTDMSRRSTLLDSIAEPLDEAVGRLRLKESQASAELLALVVRIEALRSRIESLRQRLSELAQAEADAGALLVIADAWDRAEVAIAEGRYGIAPTAKWERLRRCESTDNYQAISPSGRYRGAYQFDRPTWRTVGGTGDPALAPPAEQDARARELYARRGHQPWPVCGRYLR